MSGKKLLCSLALYAALSATAIECYGTEELARDFKSIRDVEILSMWGTENPADWQRAYAFFKSRLLAIDSLELDKSWLYEFELLGLTEEQVRIKYGTPDQVAGKSLCEKRLVLNFGIAFDLIFADGKVERVKKSVSSCQSRSIGPWVSDRKTGLLRAECDLTQALELARTLDSGQPENAQPGLSEHRAHTRALYFKRALVRHELGADEFAVSDLFSLRAVPITKGEVSVRKSGKGSAGVFMCQ